MEDTFKYIIECPICFDIYKHPYNLTCGHSLCIECIYKLTKNNNIICPLCNSISSNIFNNKKLILSKNYSLIQLINLNNTERDGIIQLNEYISNQFVGNYISPKKNSRPSCFTCCITNLSRYESDSD